MPAFAAVEEENEWINEVMLRKECVVRDMRDARWLVKNSAKLLNAKYSEFKKVRFRESNMEQTISNTRENALVPQFEAALG